MVKDMLKRTPLGYGLFGLLLASFLILLRKTVFVNSLVPWYLILILAWTIEGLLFGRIVHRLKKLLQTDELTNLYNYKSLQKQLKLELLQAKRKDQELSMLMIDVDYFKIINDIHGHLVGDEMIQVLAEILCDCFPNTDLTYRWGGEEFVVLLPNTNNLRALYLAENLRQTVQGSTRFRNNTVSVGLVTCKGEVAVPKFFDQADKAMYQAKVTRNTVHNVGVITE